LSLEIFLSIISSNKPDKYYTYYLGGVIIFINKDILNNEIRVLFISESVFFFGISGRQAESFFLRK
jgi:hypothetical protein